MGVGEIGIVKKLVPVLATARSFHITYPVLEMLRSVWIFFFLKIVWRG